ncbi:MAG: HD-GYP domain-containing protein, partial [Pseudonocardiaceae bacterium]
ARVVAVCDAYDAMTSERPYRRPLAIADAFAELRRSSGTQFDPEVVQAFCDAMETSPPNGATVASRAVPERSPAIRG